MLLPERQMNLQRFRFAEDRIDLSLYECFDKGPLSKFFIKEDLEVWKKSKNLKACLKRVYYPCTVLTGLLKKKNLSCFQK